MKDPKRLPSVQTDPAPVVPSGWSARVLRRQADPGESSHPVLHAATVPMTTSRSDYGSDVAERLGLDDALVVLMEFGPESVGTALFAPQGLPYPTAQQFDPNGLQRTITGQSGFQSFFTTDRRAFCLYVVLGSHVRRVRTLPRVHSLLDAVDLQQGRLSVRGLTS